MLRSALMITYLVLALTINAAATESSSWLSFNGSNRPGPAEIEVIEQNRDSILVDMTLDGVNVQEKEEHGIKFHFLSIPRELWKSQAFPKLESYWMDEAGKPKLPVIRTLLAIPSNNNIKIQIEDEDYTVFKGYKVYPAAKEVVRRTQGDAAYIDEEFAFDEAFYSTDSSYPQDLARISFSGNLRDERLVQLEVHPIRYNPHSGELMCYSFLQIRLIYRETGVSKSLGRLSPLASVYQTNVANYPAITPVEQTLAAGDGNVIYPDNPEGRHTADYLIIAPEPFYSSEKLKQLADWRAQYNGFDVAVVSAEKLYRSFANSSGNPDEHIRSFIQHVYGNWNAEHIQDGRVGYILLIGDVEYIPIHVSENKSFDETITTDNWYVCVNGNDPMPDIMLGRLPAKSVTELNLMVDKIIQYEKDPLYGDWANSALMLLGTVESLREDMEYARDEYLLPAGYNVSEVSGLNGGNASKVVAELNEGQQIVDYAGHGWIDGWEIFQKADISKLKNDRKLPAIFSLACSTGYFDHPDKDSLAESFLKARNGAIAFFGSTRLASISDVGFGLSEAVAGSHIYSLGEITMHTKLKLLPDQSNMELYNLLGDPAMDIYAARHQPGKADLVVSPVDISFEPEEPKHGEQVQISVVVYNFGSADAQNVTVELYDDIDGAIIEAHSIPKIPANSKIKTQTAWRTPFGMAQHSISVKAYPAVKADEYYRENNDAQKVLMVSLESEGWPIKVEETTLSAPIVADIDTDGDMELLIQSNTYKDNKLYIWHHDGQFVSGWPRAVNQSQYDYKTLYSNSSAGPAPAVGDLDGDNIPEIVAAFFAKEVRAWRSNGSDLPGWPVRTNGYATTSPVLADLDSDGKMEVIFGLANGEMHVRRHDGSQLQGWPISVGLQGHLFPIVTDLDGDGDLEIAAIHSPIPKSSGASMSILYAWHHDGTMLDGWPVQMQGADAILPPAAGDLDGDGTADMLAVSVNDDVCRIYAYAHDGSLVPGWPVTTDDEIRSALALGDLDQDGDVEIIACSRNNFVYAWHHDGKRVFGWPVKLDEDYYWNSAPVLGNVDGDDHREVIFTSYGGIIHAYKHDGTPVRGWPALTKGPYTPSPPAIADMNGDGNTELAYVSGFGDILVLALAGHYDTQTGIEWNMFLHNQMHTGSYNAKAILPLPPTNLVASDLPDDKGGSIILSWQLSPDDEKVVGYVIYRSDSPDGRYSILGKVQRGVSSYTDKTAKAGITYWYMVRTSDVTSLSVSSNVANAYAFNNFAPKPPGSVYAEKGSMDGVIDVWWLVGDEADLAGYKIHIGVSSGLYGEPVNVGMAGHYALTKLTNGTVYYISVTAYDTEGNESIYSNEAFAVPADEDTDPPAFSEFYPKDVAEGVSFHIRCNISDPSGVYDDSSGPDGQGVYLIWDDDGELLESSHTLQMSLSSPDVYATDAKIPGHSIGGKIIYQVYAYDDDYDWGNAADRIRGVSQQQTVKVIPAPSQVYNYPNPAGNYTNKTTFHYDVASDADVKINIYDVAGNLVKSFDAKASGGRCNETDWDISNVASGVYIYTVEIQPDSGNEQFVRKKLAILK